MSKIVQAINSIISNAKNIGNVSRGDSELFFTYKEKYKWSISKRGDDFYLWFYPRNISIHDLVASARHDWEGIEMVTYQASEIGTREALSSFSELFTVISGKLYGIDGVLDDIISDDDIPF